MIFIFLVHKSAKYLFMTKFKSLCLFMTKFKSLCKASAKDAYPAKTTSTQHICLKSKPMIMDLGYNLYYKETQKISKLESHKKGPTWHVLKSVKWIL